MGIPKVCSGYEPKKQLRIYRSIVRMYYHSGGCGLMWAFLFEHSKDMGWGKPSLEVVGWGLLPFEDLSVALSQDYLRCWKQRELMKKYYYKWIEIASKPPHGRLFKLDMKQAGYVE